MEMKFYGIRIQNLLLGLSICLLWPALLAQQSTDITSSIQKPNILFIAVDDLRDYIGVMNGHPDVRTPNFDRLARMGVLFTDAHCQAPMCAPSRASLLSGKLPSTTGHYGFQPFKKLAVYDTITTLPQHFREQGYYTMGCGKIHHSSGGGHGPLAEEWDEYWPSLDQPRFPQEWLSDPSKDVKIAGNFHFGPTQLPDDSLAEVQHAAWAVRQLQRDYDKPFFLALGFYRPHLPFIAPQEYFDQYPPDEVSLPAVRDNDLDDVPLAGQYHRFYRDDYIIRKNKRWPEVIRSYLACITYVDAQLGKLLDALESSPYYDNTVIVLWSDHGWHFGEKRTWRKFTLWEESTHVPLIMAGSGVPTGRVCDSPVQLLDIYPTLVALTGIEAPAHQLEGHSLMPLLQDTEAAWAWPAITTNGRNSHALTSREWKYIRYFDGSEELYDREKDPLHWNNLARKPEFDDIKQGLAKYFPAVNRPNAPGTSLKKYFSSDYPDLDSWLKQYEQYKSQRPDFNFE